MTRGINLTLKLFRSMRRSRIEPVRQRQSATAGILMVILCILCTGCSTLDTVNALSSKAGSSSSRGIAYGTHPRHVLDLYRPEMPQDTAPVVLFFYGGSWLSGERSEYEFVARRLASLGYYVAIPDYRLFPEVTFPDFVHDGARAAAYVARNMDELVGGRRPLFVAGHSAGAHIAMLLAVDPHYLATAGIERDQLAGVIGLAGPYDFLPIESDSMKLIFPGPIAQRDSQPINFVDTASPPVLLAHGDRDQTVWLRNSLNMADRLRSFGNDITLKVYPGLDHRDVLKPFVSFLDDDAGILDDIEEFVSKHSLGKKPEIPESRQFSSPDQALWFIGDYPDSFQPGLIHAGLAQAELRLCRM